GKMLLDLGYTVDQVVHDYGDLCQSISDLAFERDAPFAVEEFRTLNRCLDNAIADAVASFSLHRDSMIADQNSVDSNQRLGFLVHELRNYLQTAIMATRALETGGLTLVGATGAVLKRSHAAMRTLIQGSLADVKLRSAGDSRSIFSLASFIQESQAQAELDAKSRASSFVVEPVDTTLRVEGNRERLFGALANLLSNAFKFSHAHEPIKLSAHRSGDRVLIEVQDSCGGLLPGHEEKMFVPFLQLGDDKTGLGLGLSIARQAVESDAGTLTVKNLPGVGCVFTMDLPSCTVDRRT
ncbi:MAG: HAMP domain-containing histidine kinase, partial [Pseudomonadota bacterium]|nr:HAMP domain-containing histidine kinase [Pseudomonadota bacterium]